MNSVMNFLADYYIWFFVAALLLSFALIGFIIDTKKKQKKEFKGESIETPNNAPASTPEVIGETVNVGPEAVLGGNNTTTTLESINPAPVSDETMEINDIPFNDVNTPVENVNQTVEPINQTHTENITIGSPITSEDYKPVEPQFEELNIPEAPEAPVQNESSQVLESLSFDDNDENKNA